MLVIGPYAFQGCFNLADISIAEDAPSTSEDLFSDCIDPSDICEDTLGIGESAFVGCNSLTAISIPESVSVIETAAFCDCEGLVRIDYCGTPSQRKSKKKDMPGFFVQERTLSTSRMEANQRNELRKSQGE